MPIINSLSLENFRNLQATNLAFSPEFNFFCGNNGSGKTSLLEALFYLGHGKSFRTSHCPRLIHFTADLFRVVAITDAEHAERVGIERDRAGERRIKANSMSLATIAPLTRALPMQFMSPMSYRFFHDGPKLRRQYLDWALFHVEPSFLSLWQRLQRVLKQRNSALKQFQDTRAWDAEFVAVANQLDHQRRLIAAEVAPLCLDQLSRLIPDVDFSLRYARGWSEDSELAVLLREHAARDRQLKHTFYGPQRADFQLYCHDMPVHDNLSQGQQKLAAYALHLALGQLLQTRAGTSPIYLIDDLPSELDAHSREKIAQTLQLLRAQVFVTAITSADLQAFQGLGIGKMFHVEHGHCHETCPQDMLSPV